MSNTFEKPNNWTTEQYLEYLYLNKDKFNLTWDDISILMSKYEDRKYSKDKYRKYCFKNFNLNINSEDNPECEEEPIEEKFNAFKEIQRIKDERSQLNYTYRQIAREDMLKDIAVECANIIAENYPFKNSYHYNNIDIKGNSGILLLSDWHYGISIDNHWNKYNPSICRDRLYKLFDEVVALLNFHKIEKLYILNLGDLISGRIHSQIRIENREDVISQVMNVSEIISLFIYNLSFYVNIEYYDCLDNHSRVEPNLKESLRLESLSRIITWYLVERFKNSDSVTINFNNYSDDIVSFRTHDGWNVVGVHGDLDSQKAVIKKMRGMLIERPDLVCTAHMHHFSSNEENECILVSNPSLMGTDSFAESKRLTSKPAQTLIVTNGYSPAYAIHRIVLD